jgi:hypothetical protein
MAIRELTLRIVVEVDGEWSATLAEAVTSMLTSLQHAGHFEIVLNIQRAALGTLAGLRSLTGDAMAFRSHHGHLDIVGTVEQLDELVRNGLAGLFRLAASEEVALSRIKRIPVLSSGPRFTAHPLD